MQDEGSGPNPRQAGPHAHSFNVSPDNRHAIEAEFGMDRLVVYRFDAGRGALSPAQPPFYALKPGAAPRQAHLARVEIAVLLQEWLRRVPDYRIDEAAARRPPSSFQWGWNAVPVEV